MITISLPYLQCKRNLNAHNISNYSENNKDDGHRNDHAIFQRRKPPFSTSYILYSHMPANYHKQRQHTEDSWVAEKGFFPLQLKKRCAHVAHTASGTAKSCYHAKGAGYIQTCMNSKNGINESCQNDCANLAEQPLTPYPLLYLVVFLIHIILCRSIGFIQFILNQSQSDDLKS